MPRPIDDTWFIAIKQATRDLIKAAGNIVTAGAIAHASKSEVSRWQSATDPDIIPLAAVLALEAETGQPFVTGTMARLHGRRLDGDEAVSASAIASAHADTVQHTARLMLSMADALADGRVSPSEAAVLRRACGDVLRVVTTLSGQLDVVRASAIA
jgi:hypothetical protein